MTDDALVYICETCGESFDSTRGLASHMKKHADPVTCPQCGEEVKYLEPHMRAKHDLDDAGQLLVDVLAMVKEVRELRKENRELKEELEKRPVRYI